MPIKRRWQRPLLLEEHRTVGLVIHAHVGSCWNDLSCLPQRPLAFLAAEMNLLVMHWLVLAYLSHISASLLVFSVYKTCFPKTYRCTMYFYYTKQFAE